MRIYLLITDRCNLTCSMCIRGEQHNKDMSLKEFVKIVKRGTFSNTELVITGGEPTLHDHFIEFVKFSSNNFKKVLIATNGTTNYYIDHLKNINNLMFQISLDGDKKCHDFIRGEGSFNLICQTIKKFEKNNLKYCIASVVGYNNKTKIFDLIPFLKNLSKMTYWRISYEMPFGNANNQFIMSSSDWNNFVDEILKKVNFRLLIKKIFAFELYDKYLESNTCVNDRCFNCSSGKENFYIYPNFNTYPCTCLTDYCIGNLINSNILDIINSKYNQKFMNYKIEKDSPCHSCKYFTLCNGGCIGMSYHILGSIGKGDIRCPILRRHYNEKNILL